jgi:hypothetical protein
VTHTFHRREIPTIDGSWLILTSTSLGIVLEDTATCPHHTHVLTPEAALSLSDGLRTASAHQTLALRAGGQPS